MPLLPGNPAPMPSDRTRITLAGLEFIRVPPGEFTMGGTPADLRPLADEAPPHRVRLTQGFYLATHLVTQGYYEQVTGRNIADHRGHAHLPIESVNRDTALAFCRLLSASVGLTIRLPTEAEWEYACRAGTSTSYFFGDDPALLGDYAWHAGNSAGQIHPIGLKRPNPWGFYDLLGNVWEWCADWYAADTYSRGPATDPPGAASGDKGVLRGGSFINLPARMTCASRGQTYPEVGRSRYGLRPCISFAALA